MWSKGLRESIEAVLITSLVLALVVVASRQAPARADNRDPQSDSIGTPLSQEDVTTKSKVCDSGACVPTGAGPSDVIVFMTSPT